MIFKKKSLNGDFRMLDLNQYNLAHQRQNEYRPEDLKLKIYDRIRKVYYSSPWHNIEEFIYKDKICSIDDIVLVFDVGYVMKINYHYSTKNSEVKYEYKYIHNINSLKYLKLLTFSKVEITKYKNKKSA